MEFDEIFKVDQDDYNILYYIGALGQPTKHLPLSRTEDGNTITGTWTTDDAGRATQVTFSSHTLTWSWDNNGGGQGGDEPDPNDNILVCADVSARCGQQVDLPVMLTSDSNLSVVGISFTLKLPEGVTIKTDEDGEPIYSLVSTRLNPKRFNVYTQLYADGSWGFRISANNATAVLNGTEGEFMTLTLDVPDDMAEGDYDISLTENKLSVRGDDNVVRSKTLSNSVSKLTINNIIMGDVNGDGEVDLSDAIMVTYYSLHVEPAYFIKAAADVNGDGEIDLSDAINIIYMSLGVK